MLTFNDSNMAGIGRTALLEAKIVISAYTSIFDCNPFMQPLSENFLITMKQRGACRSLKLGPGEQVLLRFLVSYLCQHISGTITPCSVLQIQKAAW